MVMKACSSADVVELGVSAVVGGVAGCRGRGLKNLRRSQRWVER